MLLYRFEDAEFGLVNLAARQFKVSTFEDVNDPYELLGVRLKDPVLRLGYRLQKRQIAEQYGMICMSRKWSNPVLWSHYGDKHRGMALQFRVPDPLAIGVTYSPRLLEPFDGPLPDDADARGAFLVRLMSTKYASWRYESEWRLAVTLADCFKASGRWFLPYPESLTLTSIILGPRCPFSDDDVRHALGDAGTAVLIVRSRLAFNSYRVVINREMTPARVRKAFSATAA